MEPDSVEQVLTRALAEHPGDIAAAVKQFLDEACVQVSAAVTLPESAFELGEDGKIPQHTVNWMRRAAEEAALEVRDKYTHMAVWSNGDGTVKISYSVILLNVEVGE